MRLQVSKSKNSASLYVIKTVYIEGKEHTKIINKGEQHSFNCHIIYSSTATFTP